MISKDAIMWIGTETRTTANQGLKTLFVDGLRTESVIMEQASSHGCKHVCLGTNGSFIKHKGWNLLIGNLIQLGYRVTLEYPIASHEFILTEMNYKLLQHPFMTLYVDCELANIEKVGRNVFVGINDTQRMNAGTWTLPLNYVLDHNRLTMWEDLDDVIVVFGEDHLKVVKNKQRNESRKSKKSDVATNASSVSESPEITTPPEPSVSKKAASKNDEEKPKRKSTKGNSKKAKSAATDKKAATGKKKTAKSKS